MGTHYGELREIENIQFALFCLYRIQHMFLGKRQHYISCVFCLLTSLFFAFSVTSHLIQTQLWETYSSSSSSYAINPSQNFRKKNLILGNDISYLKKSEKVQPTAKFTSFVRAMKRQFVHYFLLYCFLFFLFVLAAYV